MKENIKSTNENQFCSVCGSNDVYRYSMCSKCFAENQYGEFEDEVEKELTKAPKEEMHMHSAGLRGSGDRAVKNIDKIIKRKQEVVVKMKRK